MIKSHHSPLPLTFNFNTLHQPLFPPKKPSFLPLPKTLIPQNPNFRGIKSHPLVSNLNQPFILSDESKPEPDPESEVEIQRLLSLLPDSMRVRVLNHPEFHDLIEVVLDLGRKPVARFPSGDFELLDSPITFRDLEFATSQVGDFAVDNRAGISRTLHRISAIRNRKNAIIGLTCRVGRAITGSADLLRDLVKDGASLLLIGPPGVGKTTIIREIARMLADDYKKRVMIVDTSNEIGGDGDIPHAGIGGARRMQVPISDMQHKVLIEAVENHMPQVIVIDEIGTKLEAIAASTISQRGIQLVATAHGITIENLIKNPLLDMLVGGIQSVTLGDEEASRRRVQKTILERKGPPTFRCAVEIISKTELRVHPSLEMTVDAILAGRCPYFDVRTTNFKGLQGNSEEEPFVPNPNDVIVDVGAGSVPLTSVENADDSYLLESHPTFENSCDHERSLRVFVYGIMEATVVQVIKKLNLEDVVELTDNMSEADVLLALQSKLKKNIGLQAAAKSHEKPVYVTKTSSLMQITKALRSLMNNFEDTSNVFEVDDKPKTSEVIDALEEARIAIEKVVIPKGKPVELLPRPPHILYLQVDLAQNYQLLSEVVGSEQESRVRIFPLYTNTEGEENEVEAVDSVTGLDEIIQSNGSPDCVDRLQVLPDYP